MKRELGYGHLGNGLSVWDRLHEEHGDYKKVAHISETREITFHIKNLEPEYRAQVERIAAFSDPSASTSQPEQKVFSTRPQVNQ